MQIIVAPIKPDEAGPHVANLQEALTLFFERNVIRALDPPNSPNAEELGNLNEALKSEHSRSFYGRATRRLVQILQIQLDLGDNLEGVIEDKTAERFNALLRELDALEEDRSGKPFVVRGNVAGATGGQFVNAFDKDLRSEQFLGKSSINEHGNYRIRYGREQFARADKGSADLRVAVCNVDEVEVLSSDVHFNAEPDTVIDLQLVSETPPVVSEYEEYRSDLDVVLQGVSLVELDDNDIDFLAGDTGIPRERIVLLVQAARLSIATSSRSAETSRRPNPRVRPRPNSKAALAVEIFYGWFRQGLPTEPAELWSIKTEALIAALKTAVELNIIPAQIAKSFDSLVSVLDDLKLKVLLTPAGENQPASLGNLLETMPQRLSPEKERVVAEAVRDRLTGDDRVKQLTKADFDTGEITAVQVTTSLGELTQNHVGLVQSLQTLRTDETDSSIRFLASVTPVQWLELVEKHGVPSSFRLGAETYAQHLESEIEAKHPTAVFAARVQSGQLQLSDQASKTAANFLGLHPELALNDQNARTFVNNLIEGSEKETIVDGLQKVQRVQKLAGNWQEAGIILNEGFGSALDIVEQGADSFLETVQDRISVERAYEIFLRAKQVHDTTLVLVANTFVLFFPTFQIFLPPKDETSLPAADDYPNLRRLFGNITTCECEHCQSVLSPSAYLVDLLRFLDPNVKSPRRATIPPLAVLLGRRPDIADLELTCKNTTTEIPYIDLVLEILENAIGMPIEIPKPYGFDPQLDLQQTPLSVPTLKALRAALEHSAITVGDRIEVEKSDKQLLIGLFTEWLVTDGARHWVLRHSPQSLTSWRSNVFPRQLNVPDFEEAATALDQRRLLNLDWVVAPDGGGHDGNLPLKGAALVTVSEAGKKWTVDFTRAVQVEFQMGTTMGAMILKTVDGQSQLDGIQSSAGALRSLVGALNAGRLAEPLISMLPSQLQYQVTRNGNGWEIASTNQTTITFVAERLEIVSLTYQSSSSHDDLKASAENRNPAAYDKLDKAVYPWELPFNLWLEEVRAFLNRRSVLRHQLMEQLQPIARLDDKAIARELLGLSLSESNIIAAIDTRPAWENWGLQQNGNSVKDLNNERPISGPWIQVLSLVSILLQRSGLNYRELLNVLQTRCVKIEAPSLSIHGDECDPSLMVLVGLGAAHLDRIHRFVRLSRKSGWSAFELDLAIAAVTSGSMDLNETTLVGLAQLKRLQQLLKLPIANISAWWGTLTADFHDYTSTRRPVIKSLYERLFLNPNIVNPPDRDFVLNEQKTELDAVIPNTRPSLASKGAVLTAALGITQTELDELTNDLLLQQELDDPPSLKLSNLSSLFRNVSLAKSLRLSLHDYLRIKSLIGVDPFDSPAKMVEFIEHVRFAGASAFSIDALEYLLQYTLDGEPSPLMTEQWAAAVLEDVRRAVQTTQRDVMDSADPIAATLRKILLRIGWYEDLVDKAVELFTSSGQLEVQIPGENPTVTIPAPLQDLVVYRVAERVLTASPTLTATQWDGLEAANGAAPVKAAINALRTKITTFAAALPDLLHQMQSFDLPVFRVTYDPQSPIVIPKDLAARCYFDPALKQLVFTGWMTDAQQAQLRDFLPANAANIVNQLKSDSDQYSEQRFINRFLFDPNEVNEFFSVDQTPDSRATRILGKLLPHLYRKAVIERLGEASEVGEMLAANLLLTTLDRVSTLDAFLAQEFVESDSRVPIVPAAFPAQLRALCKLHKAALVCLTLKIEPSQIQWMSAAAAQRSFNVLNLDTLPARKGDSPASFDEWQRLIELIRLRDHRQFGAALLTRLKFLLNAKIPTDTKADVNEQHAYLALILESPVEDVIWAAAKLKLQWPADYQTEMRVAQVPRLLFSSQLARTLQLSPQDVDDAIVRLDLSWPAHFQDPTRLTQLVQLLITAQRLGLTAAEVFSLGDDVPAQGGNEARPGKREGALARKLLRARYDEQSWPEQVKPVVDVLRDKQRAALVSYLVAHPPGNAVNRGAWKDANSLYDHYLIDAEMGPCRVSTRILHAISAVQLFVQRCLMHLESEVSPTAIDARRWEWMKNYRVWEANRKVFLYPENWIEPELRDDKSELFRNLEGQLQQNEFDGERAEEILKEYLKDLENISHLAVVGMYVERLTDAQNASTGEINVHVVARTRNRPARFFYRRWILSESVNRWTSWEHVPLDGIKSDHILPFVMRGDVYIAWPEITQLAAEPGTGDNKSPGAKWRLQMSWVRRGGRGWSERLMCNDTLEHPWIPGKDENETFSFRVLRPNQESSFVEIDCLGAKDDTGFSYTFSPDDQTTPSDRLLNTAWNQIDPDTWMTVSFTGRVFNSYKVDGKKVDLPAAGVTVRLSLQIDPQAVANFNNEFYWRGHGWPWNMDNKTLIVDAASQPRWMEATTNTNASGEFTLTLTFVATALYRTEILSTRPLFKLQVFASAPSKAPPIETKQFADAVGNGIYLKVSFHQNFEITREGPAPGAEPGRPVMMERIAKFILLDAEDGVIQNLEKVLWSPPGRLTSHGSGYLAGGANPNSNLEVPNSIVSVWNGVAQRYNLVPAFPADSKLGQTQPASLQYFPPELLVYRDNINSYFIRAEDGGFRSFQVVLDGHPRAGFLRMTLSQQGVPKLFALEQQSWASATTLDGHSPMSVVNVNHSVMRPAIRFEPDEQNSPYSSYNTELFFHVPFLIATFLSSSQRFADAQRWFHYIFNPTTDDSTPGNERYWQYLPFRDHSVTKPIDELLAILSNPNFATNDADKISITNQIDEWTQNPFRPHAVARLRPRAYEFAVVFKYLDNLIAWGDQLFRQYSTESINEATQLYILASKLLGPRPQTIPRKTQSPPLTYRKAAARWDTFSNAWLELEANLSSSVASTPPPNYSYYRPNNGTSSVSTIAMLYFCVPGNEKMLDYWDKVENRLFNIRHCRNIDGVEQELPLFQPPIDPALLVRAVAAGVDISSVLSDLSTPLPYYRFNTLSAKASELCNEVKTLGNSLMAALEKKDAEQLALLRATQELDLLNLVQAVRETQIEEANANIDALRQSEELAIAKFVQYQRLLGNSGAQVPDDFGVDIEQTSLVQVASAETSGDLSSFGLTPAEQDQLKWSDVALGYGTTAGIHSIISGILYAFPDIQAGTPFLSQKFGGTNLGSVLNAGAAFWSTLERIATHQANRSAQVGQYQRRQDEWVFQSRLALREVQQIRKQIFAAEIRRDIAAKELDNHKKQIKNAEETDRFMREKYTNRELYQWMSQQLSGVYFRAYQMAYDVAKRAERAFRFELGLTDSKYIQAGYWDSLKKGLLAGEKLSLDLKRMEVAYLDQNKREYEITRHVSLLSLDPTALIALRQSGKCEVNIPEVLFDLDYPGHYLRRIKSVSLTIPCVTGPYTGVNCTLSLLKSSIRQGIAVENGYERDTESDGDPRFRDTFGPIQSIVTSNAQFDAGVFETNLRDERYLPFEGAGVISVWRLELPVAFRQFDYNTVADVILHIKYTAREGGATLRASCLSELTEAINAIEHESNAIGLSRLFSLKQEFSTEWHRFTRTPVGVGPRLEKVDISKSRFPFLIGQRSIDVSQVDLYSVPRKDKANVGFHDLTVKLPAAQDSIAIVESGSIAGLSAATFNARLSVAVEKEDASWTFEIPTTSVDAFRDDIDDILMVCHYRVG